MCSIAGAEKKEDAERMLETMKHRAPDGNGVIADKKYAIGMGRLAVIDLVSKGLAPYQEDKYVCAFNGEIFNYRELRRELEDKDWVFRTQSDTEVLVKAYREWGGGCLDKLNGMFAFAIYNGKTIFLARDIAGEKPLYYSLKPFRFASEAKALDWKCDEFPPASCGIYDFKELKIERWWEMRPKPVDLHHVVGDLSELLDSAVKLRMRSDVPYGLYLSGGVDSTLLSTFGDFTETFTYDDSKYNKEDFEKVFEKIVWHLDYPSDSFSPFGQWKLAEEASKKVKVVITGEGADELFGGYVRYVPTAFNYEARKEFPSYPRLFQSQFSDVNQQGFWEFSNNLCTLLRQNDRMAAAFGLENRSPFLDRRIIEYAFSLPPEMKVAGFAQKLPLLAILARRKPDYQAIEKCGLYCSVNKWLGVEDRLDKKVYWQKQQEIWQKFQSSFPRIVVSR